MIENRIHSIKIDIWDSKGTVFAEHDCGYQRFTSAGENIPTAIRRLVEEMADSGYLQPYKAEKVNEYAD